MGLRVHDPKTPPYELLWAPCVSSDDAQVPGLAWDLNLQLRLYACAITLDIFSITIGDAAPDR